MLIFATIENLRRLSEATTRYMDENLRRLSEAPLLYMDENCVSHYSLLSWMRLSAVVSRGNRGWIKTRSVTTSEKLDTFASQLELENGIIIIKCCFFHLCQRPTFPKLQFSKYICHPNLYTQIVFAPQHRIFISYPNEWVGSNNLKKSFPPRKCCIYSQLLVVPHPFPPFLILLPSMIGQGNKDRRSAFRRIRPAFC